MNTSTKLLTISATGLILAGCATAPEPSPRLISAEQSLSMAQADPATMEMGRASLEKAETSLEQANEAYMKRKDDRYTHYIRMTEGYVELAETRGNQQEAEERIAALKEEREEVTAEKRRADLAKAEAARRQAEEKAAMAEARVQQLQADLQTAQMTETDDGMTLVLQDLQFGSGASNLMSGAQSRLQPLSAFMSENGDARVRIEGHTDAQGSEAFNQDLSQRRADAIRTYLTDQGIDGDRIETVGRGETSPIAPNDTATGRAENRRVEITILN